MSTQTFTQAGTVFDPNNGYGDATLLPVQTAVSAPQPSALDRASSPLVPQTQIERLLDHFPEAIYDIRPETHLRRFLNVLLGDSGAGQLRKRYTVARLQQSLDTSHFYDLDSFYGAIFGALRHADEVLPSDPYTAVAAPDEWDAIQTADTKFRERVKHLARGLAQGATVAGLRTLAEAVFSCPCEVYESWTIVDGGTATLTPLNRSEVIIVPKKSWATPQQKAAETYDGYRVLGVLKPAGTLLTIDNSGVPLQTPVQASGFAASSEYWEVTGMVTPKKTVLVPSVVNDLYPTPLTPLTQVEQPLVRPAFSGRDGWEVFYNADVVSVQAYQENSLGFAVTDPLDYESITYTDGQVVSYSGDNAMFSGREVLASQYTQDGVMVAAPYSSARVDAVGQ